MKLTVDRTALAAALRTATRALPRSTGLQVIIGAHLEVAEEAVHVTCTDLDLTITSHVSLAPGDVAEPGTVVIPAKALTNIVERCAGNTVTLVGGDDAATLSAGRTVAELATLPTKEWPKLPTLNETITTLDDAELATLARTLPFVGTDVNRPGLCGIVLEGDTVRATDSYRAIQLDSPIDVGDRVALVPAAIVRAVVAAKPDELEVSLDANHIGFRSPDTTWVGRLMGLEPPTLKHLIRDSSPHIVTFPVAETVEVVNRLQAIDDDLHIVRIDVADGVATFTRRSTDTAVITDAVPVEGDPGAPLAMRPQFLLDLLTACGTEEVTLGVVDHLKPVQVISEEVIALVMPVRLPA